jgi:phage terminase large subunit
MQKKIQATNVYEQNYRAKKRIILNQGGTGSSKSYSLAQLFVILGLEVENKIFSVVRKSMPTLRASAMRDFFTIVNDLGIYDEKKHNKTESIYTIGTNQFEFFGLDEPQKVRSRRRDFLWINEGNELSLESFRQLNMRTNERVYLDFNPSDEFHWIYEDVMTRDDCELIKSTYLDNPFLPELVIKEIERYKEIDDNYWNIYGLGERGVSSIRIYTNFELVDDLPGYDFIYGLDFGYNHPTALIRVSLNDNDVSAQQVIYESHLTNTDLIDKMNELNISKSQYIYADSEDPQRIAEIKQAGFNVKPVSKGASSVKMGIDLIKRNRLSITKDSPDLLREVKRYSWKTKDEQVLDEPVKVMDDGVDALRYAVYGYSYDMGVVPRKIISRGKYKTIRAGR